MRALASGAFTPIVPLVGAVLIAVACAAPAATPTPTRPPTAGPTAGTTAVATPTGAGTAAQDVGLRRGKRGGLLRMYNERSPQTGTIDPHSGGGGSEWSWYSPLYSGLLRYGPLDGAMISSALAERWEASPDGLTYTFQIRKNAKWHDGEAFTAEDAKFGLDMLMGRSGGGKTKNTLRSLLDAMVKETRVVGPTTLEVVLKAPDSSFIATIAKGNALMAPEHVVKADGSGGLMTDNAVGTGPFKLKEWKRDVSIHLERHPEYYHEGLPYLDGILNALIKDKSAVVAAFQTGQLDIGQRWGDLNPDEANAIKNGLGDKVKVEWLPHAVAEILYLNHRQAPLDNPKVREAAYLAVDRHNFVDKVWGGIGTPGFIVDPEMFPDLALPKAEVEAYPGNGRDKAPDIARAKQLLVEAGFPNGVHIGACRTSTTGTNPDANALLVADLAKVGIRCDPAVEPFAAMGPKITARDYATYNQAGNLLIIHPSSFFTGMYGAGTPIDYSGYTDPKIEEMRQPIVATSDPAEEKRLVVELQRYLYETRVHPLVPINWRRFAHIQRSYVRDWVPGVGSSENVLWDFVWFEK